MLIAPLGPDNQAAALRFLRALPYRNALPLSNATQLRARSDVLVAEANERVVGVASTYHDLPLANLTFAARSSDVAGALLAALAERNSRLQHGPLIALLPAERQNQLAQHAHLIASEIELQMVVEPETLRPVPLPAPRRLNEDDLLHIRRLAHTAQLLSWHDAALALGPAFGCFNGDQLVAMAGTHFATTDVIEIGYVATHPAYRRRGYASACMAALAQAAFRLAPRVYLMVMEANAPAVAAYKKLGFRTLERFYFTHFTL